LSATVKGPPMAVVMIAGLGLREPGDVVCIEED